MTKLEAWKIIREHVELGYEGDELDEMKEYVEEFDRAYNIINEEMKK